MVIWSCRRISYSQRQKDSWLCDGEENNWLGVGLCRLRMSFWSMNLYWGITSVNTLGEKRAYNLPLKDILQVTNAYSKVKWGWKFIYLFFWGWKFRTHTKGIEPIIPCTTPMKVLEMSSSIVMFKNPLFGLSCFSVYFPLFSSTLMSPSPVTYWTYPLSQE